ncbi:MAG: GGDEF domain-containing protein [Polyangiaceae bacterium]
MSDDGFEATVEVTVTRDFTRSWRRDAPGQAYLVVIAGPRLGHRAVLGQQALDVGRGAACGLQLDADSVSRLHARIQWDGRSHNVIDLKSTNGTYVNEARITEHALRDGDRLQIGKALLKYISGNNIESAYHEEVQRLMRYDGLTGIHNKSHFEEAFHNAMFRGQVNPTAMSLIVFDLDHFKRINDTHGHTAGDAVLRQVAATVARVIPQGVLFARVGGEEFALLGEGIALAQAHELAETVRRAVEATRFEFEGVVIPVTLSLGVAERLVSDRAAAELYQRADAQLYAAKGSGRNCVR